MSIETIGNSFYPPPIDWNLIFEKKEKEKKTAFKNSAGLHFWACAFYRTCSEMGTLCPHALSQYTKFWNVWFAIRPYIFISNNNEKMWMHLNYCLCQLGDRSHYTGVKAKVKVWSGYFTWISLWFYLFMIDKKCLSCWEIRWLQSGNPFSVLLYLVFSLFVFFKQSDMENHSLKKMPASIMLIHDL